MTPLYVSQQCVRSSLPLTDAFFASKEGFPTMWLFPQLLIALDKYVALSWFPPSSPITFQQEGEDKTTIKRLKDSQHYTKAPPAHKVDPPI